MSDSKTKISGYPLSSPVAEPTKISSFLDLEAALAERRVSLSRLRRLPHTSNLWRVTVEDEHGEHTFRGEGMSIQEAILNAIEGYDKRVEETDPS